MADKDFRKLKRWELIEIIEGLQKDLQETTEENDGNKDKKIELDAALQCIQAEQACRERRDIFSVRLEYCLWWQQFQY